MKIRVKEIALVALLLLGMTGCNKSEKTPISPNQPENEMSGFAKGADVSWLTEMEQRGKKFYTHAGEETECITLLRSLGMNAIRLRVWVDPVEGWNSKDDVLVKAWRAHQLGMRLMIDFHYSDSWADPGKQFKPAAWNSLSFDELKTAVAQHTEEILQALKEKGITPEWVQVGNETRNGMLWEEGKASEHMDQYATLNNAGYDAVKKVFNDAKVIVHLDNGYDNSLFRWLFDGFKKNGGKFDMIGMSLYPSADNWKQLNRECIANISDVVKRYDTEVMICEVGMPWDQPEACYNFLTDLINQTQAITACKGIFYWEPQSPPSWNGYTLGAFNEAGRATKALNAFKK
ncbi:MAG: glycoside hydrolase family 53 protein [Phocaeicola sp.]